MKHTSVSNIPFKSPFNEVKTFVYSVEPEIFMLKVQSEQIKPKTTTKIIVGIQINKSISYDRKYPQVGKLIVYPADMPHLKWSFYLQYEP